MKKKFGIFVLIFLVILSPFIYLETGNNFSFAANTADNVLRPLIGEQNTLFLESLFFSFGDSFKRIKYSFVKPNGNIFTHSTQKLPVPVASASAMDISPIVLNEGFSPLSGEGVWQEIPEKMFPNKVVLAKTFVRPDPSRPYAFVSLVKMNMEKLALGVQAGTYYPGGVYKIYGPGIIPKSVQASNELLAAFNGGFMAQDGHYGMVVKGKTYVPLRRGLATLLVHANGSVSMVDYTGQTFPQDVVGIRQNGPFLVRNGKITSFTENSIDTWGRTTTNSMYTWRSGIGITKNGNIIYAVGNSLIPATLAKALQEAGAVNAMQLDINPFWVRFILYNPLGNGKYTYYQLLKNMQNGGYSYLHGYNKDFFYVYKKPFS